MENEANKSLSLNSTSNRTQGTQNVMQLSSTAKHIMYLMYAFICFTGLFGNLSVIYVIGLKHKLKRCIDLYIISLAVADIFSSIFLPIVMVHDLVTDLKSWKLLGDFGCKIFVSTNHVTLLVSALMLVTMSLARHRVIQASNTFIRARKRAMLEITTIWIISVAIVSPYMHALRVKHDVCFDDWKPLFRFSYFSIVVSLSCFIPMIIMAIIYTRSSLILKRKEVPGCNNKLKIERKEQTERITKMFAIIVGSFFILTVPYTVIFILVAYYATFDPQKYFENEELLFHLNYAFYTISSFNGVVNPFIYAKMHQNMKRSFTQTVSSIWKSTSNESNITTIRQAGSRQGRSFTNITMF